MQLLDRMCRLMDCATITFPGLFRLQSDREPAALLQGVSVQLQSLLDPTRPEQPSVSPIVILQVTNELLPRPFIILSRRRAKLTTAWTRGITPTGALDESRDLTLNCLLALTQLRTLALNEIIEAEDMLYTCHPQCVFSAPELPRNLRAPAPPRLVCGGCKEFYSSLGATREIESIVECLGQR